MTLPLIAVAAVLVGLVCARAGWRGMFSKDFQGTESSNLMVTVLAVGLFLVIDGVVGLVYLALN